MFFNTILVSSFAALAAAASGSRLESLLRSNPNPANVTLGPNAGHRSLNQAKRDMGSAVLGNRCDHDIWMWSVDGQVATRALLTTV